MSYLIKIELFSIIIWCSKIQTTTYIYQSDVIKIAIEYFYVENKKVIKFKIIIN